MAGAFVGDNEGEDGEAKKQHNQQEHDEQVKPKEQRNSAAGANQTGQGDQHEKNSENNHRLFEELLAHCSATFGEPNTGTDDGDWDDESDKVENADQVIAETKHCEKENPGRGKKRVVKDWSFREENWNWMGRDRFEAGI